MRTPYVWREFNDIGGQKLRVVVVKRGKINDTKTQVSISVEIQSANGMGEISWHSMRPYENCTEYLGAILATLVEESNE